MSVLFGLTAALCWGAADMLARTITRLIGTLRTLLIMQFLGFLGLTGILYATGEFAAASHVGWQGWVWAFVAGLLSAIGSIALYYAFEIGVISVVSPIAATYAAVAVALALLTGTRLSVPHGVGIVLALVGVLLAAMGEAGASAVVGGVDTPLGGPAPQSTITRPAATRAAFLAATTALFFGAAFWLFGWQVTPVLGGIAPVWVVRLTAASVVSVVVATRGDSHQMPMPPPRWLWVALIGLAVLDTVAYVANVAGLTTGDVAVVNVLSSLFSAVTVLLAWIFLRERLLPRQWFGIFIILLGVAFVSL